MIRSQQEQKIISRLSDDIKAFLESGKKVYQAVHGESADSAKGQWKPSERFIINGSTYTPKGE